MKLPEGITKLAAKLKPNKAKEQKTSAFEILEDKPEPVHAAHTAQRGLASYSIDPKGFFSRSAVWLMGESVLFRLLGSFGLWGDSFFVYTQLLLPVFTALLFIALLLTLGKHFVWPTIIPVIFGTVFFIIRIWSATDSFPMYHIILCTLLYVFILIMWTLTVIGLIRTKWYLVPMFGLPFLYHIFIEDYPALKAGTVGFGDGMQELSVLFIMLALLCTAVGLKKKPGDEPGPKLPTIKDPNIWVNSKPAASEEEPAAEPQHAGETGHAPVEEAAAVQSTESAAAAEPTPEKDEPAADDTAE